MIKKKILITGASGQLGKTIIKLLNESDILTPNRKELDITNNKQVIEYLAGKDIDSIIHCAAIARMTKCENNPIEALKTNIAGTCNLVEAVLKKESDGKKIRFLYVSTDGVYSGEKGNYSEKDPAIPYNKYGWTKLGGECAVNILSNFCIIRTSFFDKTKINFEDAPADMYESKLEIQDLAEKIIKILNSGFVGTVNIGGEKKSRYELYKQFKPTIKESKFEDLKKNSQINMAKDASLNVNLWNKISKGNN